MIFAIAMSMRVYDYTWPEVIILTILILFWPSGAYSIGQMTPIWLLGISFAYRERNTSPFRAGIWIGIAAITKFFPAILLILFLIRKKWTALIGFGLVWLLSYGFVTVLDPHAFSRYLEVNQSNGFLTMFRLDNCAMLPVFYSHAGLIGLGIGLIFLLVIFGLNWRIIFHQGAIQSEEWFLISFLSVALLPIAWIYSLLPLIPGVLALIRKPSSIKLFGVLLLLIPMILWVVGVGAPPIVLIFFIIYGITWIIKPNQRLYSNALTSPHAGSSDPARTRIV